MPWQPTKQEIALIADMLDAHRPKAAIAKFLYISESTLRRFLARVRARRPARGYPVATNSFPGRTQNFK
jgi:hypothetical protein